ncbi:acyl-CoA thioesterase [Nitriliruptor alkaliphilus]|uniref:acyl-CoA thioesterase n=1 Tax=Nitriliruptor alkaliphilus TaxID=427918 RepID=UPI000696CF59|nr:thioesterase family protein [Nitriliruptor alkaliphilus]
MTVDGAAASVSGEPGAELPPPARIRVRFHELDPNGHVNHGVYANYFETARIELLESLGFGPQVLADRGIHLVVVELRIRFKRPAVAGDDLTITTRIAELARASSWWHQTLRRDEQVLAEAEVRSSATDPRGRPCRPPADLAAVLSALR